MPDFILDYGYFESAAQRLASGREEVATQLRQLKEIVDELIQSDPMTAPPSKTFMAAYAEFNAGVNQTLEGLLTMTKFLTDLTICFREVDQNTEQQE